MAWDLIFQLANGWAMLGWLVLIAAPRNPALVALVFYGVMALLCLTYTVLLVMLIANLVDPGAIESAGGASFTSIEGVRAIFMSDGGVTVGWVHYLALDLFAGIWIARDADAKGFSRWLQAPILFVTLMAGPVGVLIWLAMREKRARAAAGPRILK